MRLTLRLSSNMAPAEIRAGASAIRAAEMPRVWLADNPLERSAIISAAVIAAHDPSLDIGLGIVSARERHPVVLTQEAVALQSFTEGRVAVGLGIGTDIDRRRLGLPARSGLALLRETTHIVRELSAGSALPAFDAELDETIALKVEPQPLPVYLGAIGPKTLALAGEICDGAILSVGTTAAAAATAIETTRAAHADEGRSDALDIVCYAGFGGLDAEAPARLDGFAAHILGWLPALPAVKHLLEGTGVGPAEGAELLERRTRGEALPGPLVDAMSIGGSLERCLERLAEYAAAGVDEVALGLGPWNLDFESTLEDVKRLAVAWARSGLGAA